MQLVAVANSGMTMDEYDKTVGEGLATAPHPTLKRPCAELVYQPQLELLAYLPGNGFKTFIVSRGTIEFMRPLAYVDANEYMDGAVLLVFLHRGFCRLSGLACNIGGKSRHPRYVWPEDNPAEPLLAITSHPPDPVTTPL
jgi:hypothetical protein